MLFDTALDDDSPLLITAAGTTGKLQDQTGAAFGSAEIRIEKLSLGLDNRGELNIGEIESFGDHLGAEQNVVFMSGEGGNHFAVRAGSGNGIGIHTQNTRIGEVDGKLLFKSLRADAVHDEIGGAALAAFVGSIIGGVAVVTSQDFAATMVGHTDGTGIALRNMAAGLADDEGCETAAIL